MASNSVVEIEAWGGIFTIKLVDWDKRDSDHIRLVRVAKPSKKKAFFLVLIAIHEPEHMIYNHHQACEVRAIGAFSPSPDTWEQGQC